MTTARDDLIALGLTEQKRKAENSRRKQLKEARDLGIPLEVVETISDWKLGALEGCAYFYKTAVELQLAPKAKDPNRSYGSSMHLAFETLAKGGTEADAIKIFGADWRRRAAQCDYTGKRYTGDELLAMGPKTIGLLAQELDKGEVIPESVEHWLDWTPIVNPLNGETLAGFVFAGKCDIARAKPGDPGPVIEDFKTIASLTKESERNARAALMPQMTIYSVMAANDSLLAPLDVGPYVSRIEANKSKPTKSGSININVIRFPVREVTAEDRTRLFYRVRDAVMRILTYRAAEADGVPMEFAWPRNDAACFGKYGVCDNAPICYPELFADVDLERDFGLKEWD